MRKLLLALCVSLSLVSISTVQPCKKKGLIARAARKLNKLDKQISQLTPADELVDLDECINSINDYYDSCDGACETCYSRLRKRCRAVIDRISNYINYFRM